MTGEVCGRDDGSVCFLRDRCCCIPKVSTWAAFDRRVPKAVDFVCVSRGLHLTFLCLSFVSSGDFKVEL